MESSEDVLEEKLLEGQEAIMVKEDLAWKNLVLKQVNTVNQRVNVTGAFTPQILQVMRNSLISSGLPADNFLLLLTFGMIFLLIRLSYLSMTP